MADPEVGDHVEVGEGQSGLTTALGLAKAPEEVVIGEVGNLFSSPYQLVSAQAALNN